LRRFTAGKSEASVLNPKYKRILLKLSGEALLGNEKFGLDEVACKQIASSIQEVRKLGVQVAIVIGGGNIFRGTQGKSMGFERTVADHIGMLATTINGLVLQQSLAAIGIPSRVMNALKTNAIMEEFNWAKALQALENDTIVIFVGGTGNPYFTTDSAAALRASEMHADILLKATKVDGVYSEDPKKNPQAVKYPRLTFSEALAKKLDVMDATALALCRESQIPICVFNLFEKGSLLKAVCGQNIGSLVMEDQR
jgi:uridylate kinase